MQWQRSEDLSKPHPNPKFIPDSESLRLAALQASWRRDHRVAQRRIAWRWTTWYVQRYAPHAFAALLLLAGVAYLSGVRPSWSWPENPSTDREPMPRYVPPLVPVAVIPADAPPDTPDIAVEDDDAPLVLRNSLNFETRSPTATPVVQTSADTLSLKPENWLHSKEP